MKLVGILGKKYIGGIGVDDVDITGCVGRCKSLHLTLITAGFTTV